MVLRNTRKTPGKDMLADMVIAETRKEIEHFCNLGSRVTSSSAARCRRPSSLATRCSSQRARTA
jgi:hypothetical protein